MENQIPPIPKQHHALIIAAAIALLLVIYYFSTGTGSLNSNVRELEKSAPVQNVQPSTNNTVVVKCKNGDSYEIVYQPGQTNYQDLVYNKCGEGG